MSCLPPPGGGCLICFIFEWVVYALGCSEEGGGKGDNLHRLSPDSSHEKRIFSVELGKNACCPLGFLQPCVPTEVWWRRLVPLVPRGPRAQGPAEGASTSVTSLSRSGSAGSCSCHALSQDAWQTGRLLRAGDPWEELMSHSKYSSQRTENVACVPNSLSLQFPERSLMEQG